MDEEKFRQSSGSTSNSGANTVSVSGTGTTNNLEATCGCPEPGIEKIQVEQVLGAEMAQRVVEFDMELPAQKPDIDQVIDVYVKDVCIKSVDVIRDKVIVRGELAVKVMYVADLPNQPVHAFEKKHVRWTRDIEIPGTEPDMKATADVNVEFVDYDFEESDRRKVHITIVLKIWARVVTTTEMDVYALGPVTAVGEVEQTTSDSTVSAAEGHADDKVSASQFKDQYAGYGEQNVIVTGPMTPTAGMPVTYGTGIVTGNNVNVRTGPGTNFPSITKVNKDTMVTVKDQAFGWYKVVLPDGATTGWIASWLVSVNGMVTPAPKG
ncbi:SPOCS domain-containing protein [Sporolituus thermophilus]|uniref:SH3 domain-containing protein n=1 Tax=Sporolituus thermophilus DSM 23256 TaxID=1123285 RepID=A0A1G7HKZ7_9FIRM|nr:SPOCS domain-containing protein [Sporolituus thermophilus]SDF01031.1 SH3 domain-containing protein [Sporolituus thermophilus DSM 23256]